MGILKLGHRANVLYSLLFSLIPLSWAEIETGRVTDTKLFTKKHSTGMNKLHLLKTLNEWFKL